MHEAVDAAIGLGATAPGLLGITFPTRSVMDDDDADGIMAALGYAWAVHAHPKCTGPFEDRAALWDRDFVSVVVDVDMSARTAVTRTPREAFVDFVADAVKYMVRGSPMRADETRLFEAPMKGAVSDLMLWVGHQPA